MGEQDHKLVENQFDEHVYRSFWELPILVGGVLLALIGGVSYYGEQGGDANSLLFFLYGLIVLARFAALNTNGLVRITPRSVWVNSWGMSEPKGVIVELIKTFEMDESGVVISVRGRKNKIRLSVSNVRQSQQDALRTDLYELHGNYLKYRESLPTDSDLTEE